MPQHSEMKGGGVGKEREPRKHGPSENLIDQNDVDCVRGSSSLSTMK